jgi:hypothetical protein
MRRREIRSTLEQVKIGRHDHVFPQKPFISSMSLFHLVDVGDQDPAEPPLHHDSVLTPRKPSVQRTAMLVERVKLEPVSQRDRSTRS